MEAFSRVARDPEGITHDFGVSVGRVAVGIKQDGTEYSIPGLGMSPEAPSADVSSDPSLGM